MKTETTPGSSKVFLPKSATSVLINFVGVITMSLAIFYVRSNNLSSFNGAILIISSIALPIILLEWIVLKTYKRETTGLNFKVRNKLDFNRVAIKLAGLYFTLGLIAAIYYFLPVYRSHNYSIYWEFIRVLLPIILLGSIPYFLFMDIFLKNPKETYYNAGLIVLGKWKEVDYADFKNHFLGWLVKAFFLPIMFQGLNNNVNYFKGSFIQQWFGNFGNFFEITKTYFFTIDLAFVTMGYIMTLRIFDSHIRSAEPTFYGWGVALLCYPPFNNQLHGLYINYEDGYTWTSWLAGNEVMYVIWGVLILLLTGIYVWATIPFGLRFSNLTHRGILTNGPYKYLKHPAYVSKNLSWWLISIPFISHVGANEALARCIALLLLNFVYFHRARTEENHLSKDPDYIVYAEYINQKGVFRKLFQKVSFLRYKAEKYKSLNKSVNMEK